MNTLGTFSLCYRSLYSHFKNSRNKFRYLSFSLHTKNQPRPKLVLNRPTTWPSYLKLVGFVPVITLPKVAAESVVTETKDINVALTTEKDEYQVIQETEEEKTGWDRLSAVYELDEYGNFSKELNAAFQGTCMACLVGILYGGVNRSREALLDFMERNQATIFENPTDAKRRLQNHVSIHFAKGACRWGMKLSAFTGAFMLFLMSASAYRGETSVIDYTLSGTVTGAVLRLRLGPRGLVMGGIIGGFLGLFCGITSKTLLNLYGASFDDVISFQYEIEKSRKNLYKEAVSREYENSEMSKGMVDLVKNRITDKEE